MDRLPLTAPATRLTSISSFFSKEALKAEPDVATEAYVSRLRLGLVPFLPFRHVSRPHQARDIRDELLAGGPRKIMFLHGMPGSGKTTLLTEAVRVSWRLCVRLCELDSAV